MASKKFNAGLTIFLCVIFAVIGFLGGACGLLIYKSYKEIASIQVYTSGNLVFHFLELGNSYNGDCTYIKAGDVDILIDAGSRTNSIPTITAYINQFVTDNTLEYVIVTHAHQDHYAGFATGENTDSIFDLYSIGTIIDFSQTKQEVKGMYANYLRERTEAIERGATHYTALNCVEEKGEAKKVFELTDSITMEILEHEFYYKKSSDENNHSVCTLFSQGTRHFILTGDLEKEGEASLVDMNNLPKCVLYKGGHHGSPTSSNSAFLAKIQPDICAVCCCAGSFEYTQNSANDFPSQDFINRISEYTDAVYITTLGIPKLVNGELKPDKFESFNGNIVVTSRPQDVVVNCSNNNTKLKDTDWFKENRQIPVAWGG